MAFVGMQPVLTQVPPTSRRSTIATRRPASARRLASDGPACPVPMMIASCVVVMRAREEDEPARGWGRGSPNQDAAGGLHTWGDVGVSVTPVHGSKRLSRFAAGSADGTRWSWD